MTRHLSLSDATHKSHRVAQAEARHGPGDGSVGPCLAKHHQLHLPLGAQGSHRLEATALIKERTPEGVCFLAEGIAGGNANALLNGHQVRVQIEKLAEVTA